MHARFQLASTLCKLMAGLCFKAEKLHHPKYYLNEGLNPLRQTLIRHAQQHEVPAASGVLTFYATMVKVCISLGGAEPKCH